MSSFFSTLILASVLVTCAVFLLAAGWLLTGKSKFRKGGCGKNPQNLNENDPSCQTSSCDLCKKPNDEKRSS